MMVVIGVTGGFGTGKSTVSRMLKERGAVVLDADQLAHQAMEPKKLAWRKIVERFGRRILNDDETINRKRLAETAFHDLRQRKTLEAILHPQVMRGIKRRLRQLRRSRRVQAIVLDVPLLIEVSGQTLVDMLVVVTAPPDVVRQRAQDNQGWSDADIDARQAAQWDLSAKEALADVVVDNADGVEQTRKQVNRLWSRQVARRSK